ncbi:MAG: hypothetical protein VXZ72_05170 [Chlamydiota bacterium]|nr:hypothetical protein [Chlamydiota bacterium]
MITPYVSLFEDPLSKKCGDSCFIFPKDMINKSKELTALFAEIERTGCFDRAEKIYKETLSCPSSF